MPLISAVEKGIREEEEDWALTDITATQVLSLINAGQIQLIFSQLRKVGKLPPADSKPATAHNREF